MRTGRLVDALLGERLFGSVRRCADRLGQSRHVEYEACVVQGVRAVLLSLRAPPGSCRIVCVVVRLGLEHAAGAFEAGRHEVDGVEVDPAAAFVVINLEGAAPQGFVVPAPRRASSPFAMPALRVLEERVDVAQRFTGLRVLSDHPVRQALRLLREGHVEPAQPVHAREQFAVARNVAWRRPASCGFILEGRVVVAKRGAVQRAECALEAPTELGIALEVWLQWGRVLEHGLGLLEQRRAGFVPLRFGRPLRFPGLRGGDERLDALSLATARRVFSQDLADQCFGVLGQGKLRVLERSRVPEEHPIVRGVERNPIACGQAPARRPRCAGPRGASRP